MYYGDNTSLAEVIIAGILIAIILFVAISVNSCTSAKFENGTIADKYRGRYGTPHLIIEKNGDYGDVKVTEEDYFEYDIGEVYAQEQQTNCMYLRLQIY